MKQHRTLGGRGRTCRMQRIAIQTDRMCPTTLEFANDWCLLNVEGSIAGLGFAAGCRMQLRVVYRFYSGLKK